MAPLDTGTLWNTRDRKNRLWDSHIVGLTSMPFHVFGYLSSLAITHFLLYHVFGSFTSDILSFLVSYFTSFVSELCNDFF